MKQLIIIFIAFIFLSSCISKSPFASNEQEWQIAQNIGQIDVLYANLDNFDRMLLDELSAVNMIMRHREEFNGVEQIITDFYTINNDIHIIITDTLNEAIEYINRYNTYTKKKEDNYNEQIQNLIQDTTNFFKRVEQSDELFWLYRDRYYNMSKRILEFILNEY